MEGLVLQVVESWAGPECGGAGTASDGKLGGTWDGGGLVLQVMESYGGGPRTKFILQPMVLSRKFWSGENFGPGDQNSRKIWSTGLLFSENIGPRVRGIMVRAQQTFQLESPANLEI